MRSSLWIFAIATLVGCAAQQGPNVGDEPQGLTITNRAAGTIEGTFRSGDSVVQFSSVADPVVTTSFTLGETTVTYVNDRVAGTGSVATHGVLTAADHDAVLGLVDALGKQFIQEVQTEDDLPAAELMLDKMASHLAIAPVGTALGDASYESLRDVRYLSCSRGQNYLYQSYTQQWYIAWTGQGGNCEGRCGVGCGWDNTYWFRWGTGVYSQDCALHDYGLQAWTYAIDDYAASSNCTHGI